MLHRVEGWQAGGVPAVDPPMVDPSDFDAVGVATEVLVSLREHALTTGEAAIATIDAPAGWHRVIVTAQPGGHTVLAVRFVDLTPSRANNVAKWLDVRGWQIDEDARGATRRLPPGTDAMTAAMEVLGVLSAGGAPAAPRAVTAVDATGAAITLRSSES